MGNKLDYKQKVFADLFVESFDFKLSCKTAKVQQNSMLAHLRDSNSLVSEYIRGQIDVFAMSNSFITDELIKYKLGMIVLGKNKPESIISAAKLLLGFENDPDKSDEFMKLLKAIKQSEVAS